MSWTTCFNGKVVLITGASSGIGAGTAFYFSKLGASLVLTGRNESRLQEVAEDCKKSVKDVLTVKADITCQNDREKIVKETLEKFSSLDVLVNNAGIGGRGSIENTPIDDSIMDTNVRSVYQLTMLAVPHLIKSRGNIINVSSLLGLRPMAGNLSYSMSKAALDQFTRCVALELSGKSVRVNSVNPGPVISEFQKRYGMEGKVYDEFLENASRTTPLGRVAKPEEVAKAIAFLASDDASFITGVTLSVDGGRHLKF